MNRVHVIYSLRMPVIATVLLTHLSASLAGPAQESDTAAQEVVLDETGFGEGWQATVAYPQIDGVTENNTVCRVWVEDDWLHVERVSDDGIEWRVIVARASDGVMPRVVVSPNAPTIEVSYADGRFFVRDNSSVVRAVRQRLDSPRPTFGLADVSSQKNETRRGHTNSVAGFLLAGFEVGQWFCATSGPRSEELDCFVRLNPEELSASNNSRRKGSMGFGSMRDGLAEAFHGDRWLLDDGELLIANYLTAAQARLAIAQKKVRENLASGELPEIEAKEWLNVEAPLNRESLKGKVVLLDFWATTCGGCVIKMPEVQRLHDKFVEKGLVIIGIHPAAGGEACRPFVAEHGFSFPIAVDSGSTATSYGVDLLPTYFLIDREGKVIDGYSAKVPTEEQIKMLLQ